MQRKYLNWLFAGVAVFALAGLAACGGNDDGDDENGTDNGADNGAENGTDNGAENGTDNGNGDGSNGDPAGDGNGDGNGEGDDGNGGEGDPGAGGEVSAEDEEYASAMCDAVLTFQEETQSATSDLDQDAPQEDVMAAFADPFRTFADAIDGVEPPSDLSDQHSSMVSTMQGIADALESGDSAAIQELQTAQVDPAVQQRMAEAGQQVEACEGLFAAPGGGQGSGGGEGSGGQTAPDQDGSGSE